ncbi:MAG: hypothetical protein Q9221_007431 [Calogaya cf. arnoldii]
MPKGQKIVDWTNPENDKKLFHCIIMTSEVGVNYDKVAKAFGEGVPASCISQRVNKIRRDARGNGVSSVSTASIPSSTKRRPVPTASKAKQALNKSVETASDDTEEDMSIKDEPEESTPQKRANGGDKVIAGRVTKARKSPRQTSVPKKDYQKLLDPFNDFGDLVDGDGDAIFDREGLTSEDSMDTDKEYGTPPERGVSDTGLDADAGQSEV